MKIIYTYRNLKDAPKNNQSTRFTLNHGYNEETDKAYCGFNWKESYNVIGKPIEEEDYETLITCKKCRKKLGLE
ncbi:hypothetical protein [uncultured Clostridium sp.]|uniref:hypothetical protein n=1 Tax=uncultured Clostridium sp. TaxID=59620 RepID=UPI0032163820